MPYPRRSSAAPPMASPPYSAFRLLPESTAHARKWSKGTVEDWAEETQEAARKTVYGREDPQSGRPQGRVAGADWCGERPGRLRAPDQAALYPGGIACKVLSESAQATKG